MWCESPPTTTLRSFLLRQQHFRVTPDPGVLMPGVRCLLQFVHVDIPRSPRRKDTIIHLLPGEGSGPLLRSFASFRNGSTFERHRVRPLPP